MCLMDVGFNRGNNNSNNLEMPHEWVNTHKNATNGWCLEAFLQPSVIQAAEQMMERRGSVKSAWTKTGCRGINLQNKTNLAQQLDKQVWGIAYNDIIKILLKKYCGYNCIFNPYSIFVFVLFRFYLSVIFLSFKLICFEFQFIFSQYSLEARLHKFTLRPTPFPVCKLTGIVLLMAVQYPFSCLPENQISFCTKKYLQPSELFI